MQKCCQVYCSSRNQLQEFLSRSSLEHWWQGTMYRVEKQIRVLQRPLIMFFKETSWENMYIWDWCQNPPDNAGMSWTLRVPNTVDASQMLTPFKTPKHTQTLTSFKTPTSRVKRLNSRYMIPVNEVSLVISDPEMVKMAQPVKEQPLRGPPPKGSRFNPTYVEPGSTSIESTRDFQALFSNSFDCIGGMSDEYDIETDLTVLPVQHGRCKVPIEYKDEIKKEPGEMVWQGIITKQSEPTPWVSSLTYPKKANGKLRICLDQKDLNKAIIRENINK